MRFLTPFGMTGIYKREGKGKVSALPQLFPCLTNKRWLVIPNPSADGEESHPITSKRSKESHLKVIQNSPNVLIYRLISKFNVKLTITDIKNAPTNR